MLIIILEGTLPIFFYLRNKGRDYSASRRISFDAETIDIHRHKQGKAYILYNAGH